MRDDIAIHAQTTSLAFKLDATPVNTGSLRALFIRESAHYLGIQLSDNLFETLKLDDDDDARDLVTSTTH